MIAATVTDVVTVAASLVLTGGITFYGGEFEGRPLGCPGYRYERATGPWLAVDINLMAGPLVSCEDWFEVTFYDGSVQYARALDTGRLSEFTVWDSGREFVGDMPYYWRGDLQTATGRIRKLTDAEVEALGLAIGPNGELIMNQSGAENEQDWESYQPARHEPR